MMMCAKCSKLCTWLWVLAAVGFLSSDLLGWGFLGLNWWTVVVTILAVGKLGSGSCNTCQAMSKKRK